MTPSLVPTLRLNRDPYVTLALTVTLSLRATLMLATPPLSVLRSTCTSVSAYSPVGATSRARVCLFTTWLGLGLGLTLGLG